MWCPVVWYKCNLCFKETYLLVIELGDEGSRFLLNVCPFLPDFSVVHFGRHHLRQGWSMCGPQGKYLQPLVTWIVSVIQFKYHNTRAVFFSTSDRASKEVRNTREPDLRVAWLCSSPTTTSAVVGSNASVVAEVRAREHGRYNQCFRQMWVTKCNLFSASRRT